jgi:arabinan endo-1,5-alpha-L-arabinosidase
MKLVSILALFAAFTLFLPLLGNSAANAAILYVHDPCITKHDQYYYLFATGQGIAMYRSDDLLHWQMIGPVFQKLPKWTFEEVPGFDGRIWAPDIAHVDGKYYLYYSISTFGKNRSRIGLAVNEILDPDDPYYQWEDRGPVIKSESYNNFNAIDPNVIQDEVGRYWLSFGSFWSGIKLLEIDPATGAPRFDPSELLSLASRPGVQYNPIEAPFIIYKNDYYYLFVSFDFCCKGLQSTYKIAVGRSQQVTGPYLDQGGKDMRVGGGTIVLEGSEEYPGVGHNAVLQEDDSDWLVLHAYAAKRGGMSVLQIRPITWTEDGWPIAGDPLEE